MRFWRGGDTDDPAITLNANLERLKRLFFETGLTYAMIAEWPADVIDELRIINDAKLAYRQSREPVVNAAEMLAAAAARQAQG